MWLGFMPFEQPYFATETDWMIKGIGMILGPMEKFYFLDELLPFMKDFLKVRDPGYRRLKQQIEKAKTQ
ncbi:MAG: hypothetical protein ACRCYZ_04910 [Alphaproteobacteria bacterium]